MGNSQVNENTGAARIWWRLIEGGVDSLEPLGIFDRQLKVEGEAEESNAETLRGSRRGRGRRRLR
jgi:hypothetical protein